MENPSKFWKISSKVHVNLVQSGGWARWRSPGALPERFRGASGLQKENRGEGDTSSSVPSRRSFGLGRRSVDLTFIGLQPGPTERRPGPSGLPAWNRRVGLARWLSPGAPPERSRRAPGGPRSLSRRQSGPRGRAAAAVPWPRAVPGSLEKVFKILIDFLTFHLSRQFAFEMARDGLETA